MFQIPNAETETAVSCILRTAVTVDKYYDP